MNTSNFKIISHRGNINGPEPEKENSPKQIDFAIEKGYDVEVDVWYSKKDNVYSLGHDNPEYDIDKEFLIKRRDKLWCHAKNIDSLFEMLLLDLNCFWHQSDDVVLTSRGQMWTYPGKKLTKNSICVMPELNYSFDSLPSCLGYCTDYPSVVVL